MTGIDRFARRSWALVVVGGASYRISTRDSTGLKPRLLGVDGVGVVGVGMEEIELCAECPSRDPGRWTRETGAPLSETGSKFERARSCEAWNLGNREIVP